MQPLFDLEQVRIARTNRSSQAGIHHLAISVGAVCSAFQGGQLKLYLEKELLTTVGCIYDGEQRAAYLFCFVITPLGCDAERKVSGLLGLQGLKFAPQMQLHH